MDLHKLHHPGCKSRWARVCEAGQLPVWHGMTVPQQRPADSETSNLLPTYLVALRAASFILSDEDRHAMNLDAVTKRYVANRVVYWPRSRYETQQLRTLANYCMRA